MKTKVLKIQYLLIIVIALFIGCEKEIPEPTNEVQESPDNIIQDPLSLITLNKDRLVFIDNQHVIDAMNAFSEMNEEELNAWETSMGFASYRSYSNKLKLEDWEKNINGDLTPDLEISDMSYAMSTISNSNCEYQVGNSIVWLDNNYHEYIINNLNEDLLSTIKQNGNTKSSHDDLIIHDVIKEVQLSQDMSKATYQDARYQRQFSPYWTSHVYKFVFEVVGYQYSSAQNIELRNKFEYKKGSSWKHAGEKVTRKIDVELHLYNGSWTVMDLYYYVPNSSSDLIVYRAYLPDGVMHKFKVIGTMYAWTNNGGSWPIPYSYSRSGTLWDVSFI